MKNIVLIVLGLVLWGSVAADEASPVAGEVAEKIIAQLQTARPDLVYEEVERSPVPGIFQVQVTAGPLLYVTADGSHMFVGDAYRIEPGEFVNLGDIERAGLRREKLAALDKDQYIIFPAKGQTKAIINVFTDVDCGYCRKLHQEVPELNEAGVEVRYLAFPRAGIGSESFRKIAIAWCAPDQQQALTDLKNGKKVDGEVCDNNPVAEQYRLGREFGVNGTPALVLMDGTLVPGYRPAKELLALLGVK